MTGEIEYVEVDFHKYCAKCEYKNRDERQIPCCYCLEYATREYTDCPVNWKEKKGA